MLFCNAEGGPVLEINASEMKKKINYLMRYDVGEP